VRVSDSRGIPRPVERVLVSKEDAARMLAMSIDHFERHVQPDLRLVRSGRLVRVPVDELHRWADRSAAHTLQGGVTRVSATRRSAETRS